MYTFERFEAVGSTFVPKMSVRQNGQVGISQGALRRFQLEDGTWYVVLFFDKGNNVVGIKPTRDADEPGATKIVKREVKSKDGGRNITAYFSAKSFQEFYALPYKDRIRLYEPVWDDGHAMIVLNLNEEKKTKGGTA